MAEEEPEEEGLEHDSEFDTDGSEQELENVIQVKGMYNNYFLDYASYVILERAVPHCNDGMKPVQRRILHSLREMDDGRFHKVANVIGNTMKFHPHGDASIGDAMVQIGQKELLLDMQGNWGNILTGDRAAAPRYIEVKLSKFALEVMFNHKTTKWLSSYDGRNKEPDTLPAKFPILLAHGVEGIAVGLACKMLPHNFIELIDQSINHLKGKKVSIVPDFATGGTADFSNYNDGLRGGKVKVRARIKKESNKLLSISEIPFGTTTSSLIESILKANDKGKIKVKKVEDNTAELVEILIHLPSGVSPDKTIDALYAFSDCEVSISPNACVIEGDKPHFLGVSEILRRSTDQTRELLKLELEIKKNELEEQWHFSSLEKIFIENRIYRDIEECETWEAIIAAIHKGLKPHVKHLLRKVTDEDVARLTEIKIKRISRFDSFKADEKISGLEESIAEVQGYLDNLTEFAINYFKNLKTKYGEGKERKTEIKTFDSIDRTKVAVANAKLYINKEEGFIGTGLKRSESEFVCDCSDIDNVIIFRKDGVMLITKVSSKAFVGKNIIHAAVWKKGDKRTVYNMIYQDGKMGKAYMKRFNVTSITRDKEYHITKGTPGSVVHHFTANPNGEAEVVTVFLRQLQKLKKLKFDIDFGDLAIKGRGAGGNTVTKYPIKRVDIKEKGVSTLGARKIWFDETVQRLNGEGRGKLLGEFSAEDKILVLNNKGNYKLIGFDLSYRFDESLYHVEKWIPQKPISVVYYEGEKEDFFVKRFLIEGASATYIGDHENSRLEFVSTAFDPIVKVIHNKRLKVSKDKKDYDLHLNSFISVKGMKALGNKLSSLPITKVEKVELDVEAEMELERQFLQSLKKDVQEAEVVNESDVSENIEASKVSSKNPSSEPVVGVKDKVSESVEWSMDTKKEDPPKNDDPNDDDDQTQITLF